MLRVNDDVSRIVCENTTQENERRLLEAQIKNQGKSLRRQDLDKLFIKLNQAMEMYSGKPSEKSSLSCYSKNVGSCWYGSVPGFPSGSWWGIRMDCSRDRVHYPFDVDIHEGPFGIISVCTSHTNMKEDVDFGNFLTLTGQVYHEERFKVDFFIYNYKNQIPLRLIRSYNLQDNIAPNTGYRYDGLYIVIGCWIGVVSDGTKYNKYALMRLADQELPNWSIKYSENTCSTQHCSLNIYSPKTDACDTNGSCRKRQRDHNSESLPVATPMIDNNKKFVSESSIVTRHVFKKPVSNVDSTVSVSVSEQKISTCLGVTKTHSTNISIRTGLYESAHNALDTKKSVSTMLHKSSKQNNVALRTTSEVDVVHLTSRESSKFIGRIDTNNADQSLSTDVLSTDTPNESVSPKNKEKLYSETMHWLENPIPLSSSLNNSSSATIDCKEQCKDAVQSSTVQKSNNETSRNSAILNENNPKIHDTWKITSDSTFPQNVKSFESLTPDKILNLINKEKHRPLSKLLIGNVIGLTVDELTRSGASEVSDPDLRESKILPKINLKKICKGKDNVKENVACLNNRRYCKYSKSKRLSWKMKKQTDEFSKMQLGVERQSCNSQKCNTNTRRSDRNAISEENGLLSFRVQTSLQTIAKSTRSSCDIKTRLRTDRDTLIAKQKFPNSSIKKNRYKKQDREIANLSIDANFGPITRGPRNRRLRYKANMYTNKRYYGTFNAVIYPPKKQHSFKRKNKLTKISGERHAKATYRVSNTLLTTSKNIGNAIKKRESFCNTTDNEDSNNIDRKRENRTIVSDNITKTSFDRSLRKKLMQTHRSAQTSHLNNHFYQTKRPNTADATTQCGLTSDPEVYIVGQLDDQRTILKMKWDKLSKFKSESICGIFFNNPEICQNPRLCFTSMEEDSACHDEYVNSLQDRPSAFVPVNASNSNLRIARLRSIGFKPISIKSRSPTSDTEIIRDDLVTTSKKTKQDVAEKCTNAEDNVVVCAEDKLQYQDIEEEDERSVLTANTLTKSTPKGVQDGTLFLLPSFKNLESPWHGWKKIETDERSYWIGW